MTRKDEIEYNRRRENEELIRSINVSLVGIEALHYELATRYAAKAEAIEADPGWRAPGSV